MSDSRSGGGRLRRFLAGLLRRRTADAPHPRPRPRQPVAVVGDIHGRADLLERMLELLRREAPDALPLFAGDHVDRGPDSRAVLERLRALPRALCLRGNHEAMMLDFLDAPAEAGGRWLRNGGLATLESFGIALSAQPSHEALMRAGEGLRAALGETERWLRALPLRWQSGDLLVCHAGPDPAAPVAAQPDEVFLWGHPRFLREPRHDGLWVAHGHWVQERAGIRSGRIAVDTGAWRSGCLSAALITPEGELRFLEARLR